MSLRPDLPRPFDITFPFINFHISALVMKRLSIALILTCLHFNLPAQEAKYPPLDELGWEAINFEIPENLTETDTGSVNYLVTLKTDGKVADLEIIGNTFDEEAEKIWRHYVNSLVFVRKKLTGSSHHKGTLFIRREYCNPVLNMN